MRTYSCERENKLCVSRGKVQKYISMYECSSHSFNPDYATKKKTWYWNKQQKNHVVLISLYILKK